MGPEASANTPWIATILDRCCPALRHRLIPDFGGEADGITVDEVIDRALERLPV
jgi:hypothetical protein